MIKEIEEAIQEAKAKGVRIVRRHQFRWGDGELPIECDAVGALQIKWGTAQPGFPRSWLRDFCKRTGKDTYWFWRFTQGWNYQNRLTITRKDPKTKEWITSVDKVSRLGDDLAKRYAL